MNKMLTLRYLMVLIFTAIAFSSFSQAAGDFRTHQTGNWNEVNTWERYDGATWVWPAPSTPTSADGVITIQPGKVAHFVTVTANVAADQVIINPTLSQPVLASLIINSGVTLTVENGSGADLTALYTNLTVNGTLTINNGAELNGGGGNGAEKGLLKVNAGGILNVNGAIVGTQTVPIEINISGTANIPGSVSDERYFYVNSGGNVNLTGSIVLNSHGNVCDLTVFALGNISASGTSTISSFRGNGGDVISIYGNVSLSGTSTIASDGVATVKISIYNGGTLELGPDAKAIGKSFNLDAGGTLKIGSVYGITTSGISATSGNVQNATTGGSTRVFNTGANFYYNGIAPQITNSGLPAAITGAGSLTVNNTAGVTLTNHITTPTLNLLNGILNGVTNSKNTTMSSSSGTVNRTNGWVYGYLVKNVELGVGTARTFEVGLVSNYNQMDLNFASVTTAGSLAVRANAGDHASIGSSSIHPAKSVNVNWTANNTGIAFTSYSATFTFANPADMDPGANPANFWVQKFSGGLWGAPAGVGTRTATTTQGTGFTSFSDFQVGELAVSGAPPAALFFRSVVTGNWNDLSTWEWSSDGTSWNAPPASHTPNYLDRTITIQGTHTVTVTADVTTDETIIDPGGILTVNSANTLTISDGTDGNGFDLTINGTLAGLGKVVITSGPLGTASIGQSTGTSTNANIQVQRYIPAKRAWRMLSVPITGNQTINDAWQEGQGGTLTNTNPTFGTHITGGSIANGFDQNAINNSSLRIYNNINPGASENNWLTGVPNTNDVVTGRITNQKAYMLFVRGSRANDLSQLTTAAADNTTLRMTGSLKMGDQVIPIDANGFTVVGNPYAAPINLHNIGKGNSTNVADNFYVWDPKLTGTYGVGSYVNISWNTGTNSYDVTPVGVGSSPTITQYIQSGQAFLATQAISGTSGSLVIKEADKVVAGSDNVFRTLSNTAQNLRVNLNIVMNDGSTQLLDGVLNSFSDIFSNTIDKSDSRKPGNLYENIGIVRDGETFMVERKQFTGEPVNLKIWQLFKQTYQLEVTGENFDNGITASVYDNYLKTSTPVKLDGTTFINFTVNDDAASSAADRFYISFAKAPIVQLGNPAIVVYPNPVTNGNVNVRFNNQPQGVYGVRIFNSLGQAVATRQVNHAGGNGVETIKLIGKGMYQVEVTKPDNSKISSKIIAN